METSTRNYEATHGRQPKGTGMWMFKITGTDNKGRYTKGEYSAYGSLPEARSKACREMKSEIGGVKRIVLVEVLP
jgi:hypothetical protein